MEGRERDGGKETRRKGDNGRKGRERITGMKEGDGREGKGMRRKCVGFNGCCCQSTEY